MAATDIHLGVPGGTLVPLFLPDDELESTGILNQTRPWTHAFHGIDALHAAGRLGSKRVLIAVLDTGIQVPPHPDLTHVDYSNSLDFVRQGINDVNGHGTHCTGTVTATAANRVLGVAPNCTVIHYKVLTNQGSGGGTDIARAIRQVAAIQGYDVKIISGSFGSGAEDPTISAAVREAHRAGVIQVYAAGNSGPNSANWPGVLPEVIAVGACDSNGNIANFSSSLGDYVDVVAGGVNIPSSYPGNRIAVLNGTSMATPFVAGLIGVACAFAIEFSGKIPTDAQVKEALYATCRRIGSGRTERGGWGQVRGPEFADRLARALGEKPPEPEPKPKPTFKITVPRGVDEFTIEVVREST